MRELSERQLECLRLSATMTDKDIARVLDISPRTVSVHISEAMRRLGQPDRRSALRVLLRENPQWGPTPIPDAGEPSSDGLVSAARIGALADGPASPSGGAYGLYARLGSWRTPPRGSGVRAGLIIGVAFFLLLLIGGAVALMRVVYEVLEHGLGWQN